MYNLRDRYQFCISSKVTRRGKIGKETKRIENHRGRCAAAHSPNTSQASKKAEKRASSGYGWLPGCRQIQFAEVLYRWF